MLIEAIGAVLIIVLSVVAVVMASISNSLVAYYSLLPAIGAFGSEGGLTSNSFGGVMYVQNSNSSSISVIDLATNSILLNITLDEMLQNIKLSDDQLTLYIMTTDGDSGSLFMFNTTSNELIKEVTTEASVQDVANFNGTLYVSDLIGGKVQVMNTNGTLIDEIDVGARPQFMEVRPDGQVLYITRSGGPISVVEL